MTRLLFFPEGTWMTRLLFFCFPRYYRHVRYSETSQSYMGYMAEVRYDRLRVWRRLTGGFLAAFHDFNTSGQQSWVEEALRKFAAIL